MTKKIINTTSVVSLKEREREKGLMYKYNEKNADCRKNSEKKSANII